MQGRSDKIKRYTVVSSIAGSKLVTSAGQSAFAMDQVSAYILQSKTNPARYGITGVAIISGALVNMLTRIPAIYKKYGTVSPHPDSGANEEDAQFEHVYARIIYYMLLTAGIVATEINDPLGAYLGSVVMSESVGKLFGVDIYDRIWMEIGTQIMALVFSVAIALNNNAYDFQFVKRNVRELCEYLDQKIVSCNKSMLETMIFSFPVLLGAPVLTYFFNKPALLKIPGAQFILRDTGISIATAVMATAAFVRGIASLPSVYKAIYNFNMPQQGAQSGHYPYNCKMNTIRVAGGIGGTFDSITAGLFMLVGMVSILAQLLHLSGKQLYHWGLILIAVVFGVSQAVQNMLFSVLPGLEQTMQDLNKDDKEILPLLTPVISHEDETVKLTVQSEVKAYGSCHAAGMLFSMPDRTKDQIKEAVQVNITQFQC